MVQKCPKCGTELPGNAKFCPECGSERSGQRKVPGKPSAERPVKSFTEAMRGYNLLYIVALVALITVGVYSYRFFLPPAVDNPHAGQEMMAQQAPPIDQARLNDLKARVAENPEDLQANLDMGNFLFDNSRYEEALKYYQKVLEKEPENADVVVDLGVCYFNLQNLQQAEAEFSRALEINGEHPNALYNLGVVSAQQGDMQGMLTAWEKLIEVAPESGPAQTAKQMIDQVRNSESVN